MDLDAVRKMILEGRAAEAEARLRDDHRDPWASYLLGEVILLQSPSDIDRIEEAIDCYRKAEMRFGNDKEEALAKCARAKAVAMLGLADRKQAARVAEPDPLLDLLKQIGHEQFLPGERQIIETLRKGGHVFAVLPKRAQLLKDLVELSVDGAVATMRDVKDAPAAPVRVLIVERAHRAAESAPDHDPALVPAINAVKATSIFAISGAATPGVRADAISRLGIGKPFVAAASLDLPGLMISVIESRDKAATRATVPAGAVVFDPYPATLEEFYDRAADAKGEAVILYDPADKAAHRAIFEEKYPDEAGLARVGVKAGVGRYEWNGRIVEVEELRRLRAREDDRLKSVEKFCETRACRRRELLTYFGETPPAGWQCSGCDRCKAAPAPEDLLLAVIDGVRELQARRLTVGDMARGILFMGPPASVRALKGKTETEVRQMLLALGREGRLDIDGRSQQVKVRNA